MTETADGSSGEDEGGDNDSGKYGDHSCDDSCDDVGDEDEGVADEHFCNIAHI